MGTMLKGANTLEQHPAFITVGRIIHYTAYNGTCLAAIVTAVDTDAETVDLAVFTSMPNIAGNKNGGVQFHFGVAGPSPDGQKQPGCWHWPERV